MDEITILDKTYISSKRAAVITGYAKDYVGQLCREGHVDAKMVGRSWYVFEPSIRKHRFGEDAVVEEVPQTEPEIVTEKASTDPVAPAWEPSVYKAESVDMIPELETLAPASTPAPTPASHTAYTSPFGAESIAEDTHATLTDMQSAWREWFERKQEVRIEAPEPELMLPNAYDPDELLLEASEETEKAAEEANDDEFTIPIHKMQEEDTYEVPESDYESEFAVPIQRIAPATRAPQPAPAYVQTTSAAPVSREEESVGVIRKEKVTKRKTKRTKAGKHSAHTNAPAIAGLVAVAMISLAVAAVGTGYAERYLSGHVVNNPVVNFLVGSSEFKR